MSSMRMVALTNVEAWSSMLCTIHSLGDAWHTHVNSTLEKLHARFGLGDARAVVVDFK